MICAGTEGSQRGALRGAYLCTPRERRFGKSLLNLDHMMVNWGNSEPRWTICRQIHAAWLPSLLKDRILFAKG